MVIDLHPLFQREVFCIGHESVRNACMHSGGNRIEVELSYALTERIQQLHSIELQLARPRNIPDYSMGPRLVDISKTSCSASATTGKESVLNLRERVEETTSG